MQSDGHEGANGVRLQTEDRRVCAPGGIRSGNRQKPDLERIQYCRELCGPEEPTFGGNDLSRAKAPDRPLRALLAVICRAECQNQARMHWNEIRKVLGAKSVVKSIPSEIASRRTRTASEVNE
jgi:hypothetical protein